MGKPGMTQTPQHELVQTAAARPTETDSRDVLLAALQVAAEIAADPATPATSRTRALTEIKALSKRLDDIDGLRPRGAGWADSELRPV